MTQLLAQSVAGEKKRRRARDALKDCGYRVLRDQGQSRVRPDQPGTHWIA